MANKTMMYGSNEATPLTGGVASVETMVDKELQFGLGIGNSETLTSIAAKSADDSKLRFVAVEGTQSGIIFAGNTVVSSKILDITTNRSAKKVFDPETGNYVSSTTEKVADKVTIKWFGTAVDEADNTQKTQIWETEFDIIDRASVNEMIKSTSADLQEQIDNLVADVSILNTSVNTIEDFLKEKTNITTDASSALTITPSEDDNFTTYNIDVNVDNETIKVIDNKLTAADFKIARLESTDDGYDEQYASQYSLAVKLPGEDDYTLVGDTIDIMKDFLLKEAHVCSFNYVKKEDGTYSEIIWDGDGHLDSYTQGAEVTEYTPAYALLDNGNYEKAPLGKHIKLGNTYLHMVLNTTDNSEHLIKPTEGKVIDESLNYENDQLTDVYLDFTEIFSTFKGDDTYITIAPNGVISLNPDAVTTYVNKNILGTEQSLTDKIDEIDASIDELRAKDASIDERIDDIEESLSIIDVSAVEERLEIIETSVNKIEGSYLSDVVLNAPKTGNEQFNELVVTKTASGTETQVSVDIANEQYYTALNDALDTLQSNDAYLAGLLTWKNLD